MKKRIFELRKYILACMTAFCMLQISFLGQDLSAEAEEITTVSSDASVSEGTYTVPEEWTEDEEASTEEKTVYVQSAYTKAENTSTISISYVDTNYSVLEYEQLRDMLTNNLFYSNVNAQISTSAVYTLAKDYLYILLVDDSAKDYRDIYHYVVGDYRCFLVEVREMRSEAEAAEAQDRDTPQETAKKIAEEFTWNTVW